MDYMELAKEFLYNMFLFRNSKPQKNISGSMQGETFVLQYISLQNGNVVPGEISGTMDISSARIAATLNSLEKKGLITRRIDTADRRRILIGLTEAGEAAALRQHESVTQDAARMLSLLGEHDAKEFVRIIGRLAEALPNFEKGESCQC